METSDIQLTKVDKASSEYAIKGINGDCDITNTIARAVDRSGRLFPFVVRHVALNRIQTSNEEDIDLTEHMRTVRDELTFSLNALQKARRMRQHQYANMTHHVAHDRPPYFVR